MPVLLCVGLPFILEDVQEMRDTLSRVLAAQPVRASTVKLSLSLSLPCRAIMMAWVDRRAGVGFTASFRLVHSSFRVPAYTHSTRLVYGHHLQLGCE